MSQELVLDLRGVAVSGAHHLGRSTGPTLRMESRLTPGCHAVVVQSPLQADALILTCTGLQKARQGRPRLGGKNPYTSPRTRLCIASTLAEELPAEQWPEGISVADVVREVELSYSSFNPTDQPRRFSWEHVEDLKHRSYCTLENEQRRRISLELALSHPGPQLALLYEPWSIIHGGKYPEQRLLMEIRRLVRQGCIVVLLTVSEQQAERYSPRLIHPSLQYTRRSLVSLGARR